MSLCSQSNQFLIDKQLITTMLLRQDREEQDGIRQEDTGQTTPRGTLRARQNIYNKRTAGDRTGWNNRTRTGWVEQKDKNKIWQDRVGQQETTVQDNKKRTGH